MTVPSKKAQLGQYLIVGFIVSFMVYSFIFLIFPNVDNNYEFETITKVSDKYTEPIYLSFHWKVEAEELMTGQKTYVWIEAQGLPYSYSDTLKKIQIKFEGIGHWKGKTGPNLIDRISKLENVTLQPKSGEKNIFKSDTIPIRYAVDGYKSVLLCDYNTDPVCTRISDVIEVAPHAKTFDITMTTISVIAGTVVVVLVAISVLISYRNNVLKI